VLASSSLKCVLRQDIQLETCVISFRRSKECPSQAKGTIPAQKNPDLAFQSSGGIVHIRRVDTIVDTADIVDIAHQTDIPITIRGDCAFLAAISVAMDEA
jgi:hypothetical protein